MEMQQVGCFVVGFRLRDGRKGPGGCVSSLESPFLGRKLLGDRVPPGGVPVALDGSESCGRDGMEPSSRSRENGVSERVAAGVPDEILTAMAQ